jgi:hypothetical protein
MGKKEERRKKKEERRKKKEERRKKKEEGRRKKEERRRKKEERRKKKEERRKKKEERRRKKEERRKKKELFSIFYLLSSILIIYPSPLLSIALAVASKTGCFDSAISALASATMSSQVSPSSAKAPFVFSYATSPPLMTDFTNGLPTPATTGINTGARMTAPIPAIIPGAPASSTKSVILGAIVCFSSQSVKSGKAF